MSENIIVNGKHLVLLGISGDVGDANAVASISVPVEVPDLVSAFSLRAEDVASAVGISGLKCTGRPFSQLEHGGYEIHFKFEGFNSQVSYEDAQEKVQVRFDPEEKQDPVETHPKFLEVGGIADKWKYQWEPEKFPKDLSGQGSSVTSLSKADNKLENATNPMFGVDSWMNFGGTFTRSYACTRLPSDLYENIGILIDTPPDAHRINLPRFKGRKWLKMPPTVETGERGSGSAIRISERYRLTGILRGNPSNAEILYAEAQLT